MYPFSLMYSHMLCWCTRLFGLPPEGHPTEPQSFQPWTQRSENNLQNDYTFIMITIINKNPSCLQSDLHTFSTLFLHSRRHRHTKVKVKQSLYMPWRHTGEVTVQLHSFLTLAVNKGKCSALRHSCFTPEGGGEGASSTCWIGGWVGHRASLKI